MIILAAMLFCSIVLSVSSMDYVFFFKLRGLVWLIEHSPFMQRIAGSTPAHGTCPLNLLSSNRPGNLQTVCPELHIFMSR